MLHKFPFQLCFNLLVFFTAIAPAYTQEESVDLKKVRIKSIRDLVIKEKVSTASDFQLIPTACYREEDSVGYMTDIKTFTVNARIGRVWEEYKSICPRKAWNGRMVRFGFLFSKPKNRFFYPGDDDEPIRVGSIIYVNLRMLLGLKNLGVAFEVTSLDEASKTIRFCYLKDGASNGSQDISFNELPNGDTRISHLSHYKSRSSFRDKKLYPLFHGRFVGEFHENILRQFKTGY